MPQEKTIWDFPTRLFHWSLVVSVTGAALTGYFAPDAWITAHAWFGTAVLALIIFRLVWGLVGSHYSRFSSFFYSLAETKDYALGFLKKDSKHHLGHNPGHNPLGALMIFALLGSLIIINLSGYVVWAGEENQGPLTEIISKSVGDGFEDIHEFLANFLMFLIGAHLFGVWIESKRTGENLPRSMVTGRKSTDETIPNVSRFKSVIGSIGLVLILGSSLYWVAGY